MVVDFHTHIWPDAIAKRTVEKLAKVADIPFYTNGTRDGLLVSMEQAGISLSVVLPVVTRPEQFDSVNQFARRLNQEPGILSFGGIHPGCEEYQGKLEYIKSIGLVGIKLHPDYQQTYIEAEAYINLIGYALNLDLCVSVHAGMDVGLPEPIHCTPKGILTLYDALNLEDNVDNKLIFAHTGGYHCWEEVYELLAGKKMYFDISYSLGEIPEELFLGIIKRHGSRRILFGTDSPWGEQRQTLEYVKRLPLTEIEKDNILFQNARHLLNL